MQHFERVAVGSFTLKDAGLKSVKADLLAGTVTVSFVLDLNDETLRARKHLRSLSGDDDVTLDLNIIEKSLQPVLPGTLAPDEKTTTTLTATGADGVQMTNDFDKAYEAVMTGEPA